MLLSFLPHFLLSLIISQCAIRRPCYKLKTRRNTTLHTARKPARTGIPWWKKTKELTNQVRLPSWHCPPLIGREGVRRVPREATRPLASHQSNQSIIIQRHRINNNKTNSAKLACLNCSHFWVAYLASAVMEGGDLDYLLKNNSTTTAANQNKIWWQANTESETARAEKARLSDVQWRQLYTNGVASWQQQTSATILLAVSSFWQGFVLP